MTVALSGAALAQQIGERFPRSVIESSPVSLVLDAGSLLPVATYLKTAPELDFDYLTSLTAVDYLDYFEVVYHLTSLRHNHSLVVKVPLYERENPSLPSVVSLWQGADFQEREVFDLLGIGFDGHPNLRRIFLWEGFKGHPLHKDFP